MSIFDFLKKLPTQNELKGSLGEWLAKMYAKTLPGAMVLHDVLIDGAEQGTSQIDLLIIGNKGIYVVEVKLYTEAKIYGDARKAQWSYYLHGHRYAIYSPLLQNQKHVQYLRDFLKDFGEVPLFSVVAMICEDFKVSGDCPLHTALASSFPAMEQAIYALGKNEPEIWNEERKKEIYTYIQNHQYAGKEARLEHKDRVSAYKTEMEQAKQKTICPYCKVELVPRKGKYGDFYGCPNYPKCKYTSK